MVLETVSRSVPSLVQGWISRTAWPWQFLSPFYFFIFFAQWIIRRGAMFFGGFSLPRPQSMPLYEDNICLGGWSQSQELGTGKPLLWWVLACSWTLFHFFQFMYMSAHTTYAYNYMGMYMYTYVYELFIFFSLILILIKC